MGTLLELDMRSPQIKAQYRQKGNEDKCLR